MVSAQWMLGRNLFMSAAKNTVRIQRMCVAALLCAIAIPAGLVLGCAGIGVTLAAGGAVLAIGVYRVVRSRREQDAE